MCSVFPPSANSILIENADRPAFGDLRAAMTVLTVDRALFIAAFIRGSSSAK
jgi:hypothetical protein